MIAILIAHLPERVKLLNRVLSQIDEQRSGKDVRVFIDPSRELTTGQKRNRLLAKAEAAGANYVAFVDDDDLIGPNYIKLAFECEASGMDCMELWGQYWENGKQLMPFHHSIKYDKWWQDNKAYYRNPNHISLLKMSAIKGIQYKSLTIGEDGNYSIDLQNAGVLKTMYPVNEIIYYYFAGGKRDYSQEPEMAKQRGIAI